MTQTETLPPALAVDHVSADYGHGPVIEDVAFEVGQGETFGLMGLNGVGKTTLIKILLGLMNASSGGARIFGGTTVSASSKERLAYLPEKFEPPPFLTGMEFVRFSLKLYNRPFSRDEVLAAADRLALDRAALDRLVGTYSKGMRQKTGLLGTILTGCPLLILDEPMSGLDPRARALVKDEIMACKRRGMTVFLSSHILADMDEVCDRVGIIHGRRLRFLGTPAELKKTTGQEYLERAFLKTIDEKAAA